MVLLDQVHSARVVTVTRPFASHARPEADGLVTSRAGLVLGIVTADCVPVLLADRSAGVVGAAHAGWRGALGGVVEATIDAMCALGASRDRIASAIGPCIRQFSYEVDDAFRARFDASDGHLFATARDGHWYFDLPGYVDMRLQCAGITDRSDSGLDTYTDAQRFHSYRRATHEGRDTAGRQYSLVAVG